MGVSLVSKTKMHLRHLSQEKLKTQVKVPAPGRLVMPVIEGHVSPDKDIPGKSQANLQAVRWQGL